MGNNDKMTGFCFAQFSDYQNYILTGCVKDNPTMERSVALCNGISQWVQLMVLSRPTPQLRAEVFIKFLRVAQVWMVRVVFAKCVNSFAKILLSQWMLRKCFNL